MSGDNAKEFEEELVDYEEDDETTEKKTEEKEGKK